MGSAVIPAALLVVSCGTNGTTETAATTLTFEPATATLRGTALEDGLFQCSVDMTIVAHGSTDRPVFLESVTTVFYDSTGAKANTVVSSGADWFGVASLNPGDMAVAHRQPTGRGVSAFSATNALAYLDQFGRTGSATFTLKCTG
jgi:hypothetical protein